MKKNVLVVLIGIGVLFSCKQEKRMDDPEILKKILSGYFDALKNRDYKKMKELTTSNFMLFENGKVFTNDSVINSLNKYKSFTGTWKFDNMKVNIDESSGDIVYFDHGEITINDTTKFKTNWIESATFRKVDDKWKMNFLHSTVKK